MRREWAALTLVIGCQVWGGHGKGGVDLWLEKVRSLRVNEMSTPCSDIPRREDGGRSQQGSELGWVVISSCGFQVYVR